MTPASFLLLILAVLGLIALNVYLRWHLWRQNRREARACPTAVTVSARDRGSEGCSRCG